MTISTQGEAQGLGGEALGRTATSAPGAAQGQGGEALGRTATSAPGAAQGLGGEARALGFLRLDGGPCAGAPRPLSFTVRSVAGLGSRS